MCLLLLMLILMLLLVQLLLEQRLLLLPLRSLLLLLSPLLLLLPFLLLRSLLPLPLLLLPLALRIGLGIKHRKTGDNMLQFGWQAAVATEAAALTNLRLIPRVFSRFSPSWQQKHADNNNRSFCNASVVYAERCVL